MASKRGTTSDWQRQARLSQQAADRLRREAERSKAATDREARAQHKAARADEAAGRTRELEQSVQRLEGLLRAGLNRSSKLQVSEQPTEPRIPLLDLGPDARQVAVPAWEQYAPTRPGALSRLFGGEARYQRDVEAARAQHQRAVAAAADQETARLRRVEDARAAHAVQTERIVAEVARRNLASEERTRRFAERDQDAVIDYLRRVLMRVPLPPGLPRRIQVTFDSRTEQAVIQLELPSGDVVPTLAGYRYLPTKDELRPTPRSKAEIDRLYLSVISQFALLHVRDVFDADTRLRTVALNGLAEQTNPATGVQERLPLISVNVERDAFPPDDNLAKVDPVACLRHLRAIVSSHPYELTPIEPILDFDLTRFNFIEGLDAVSSLDSRPDLMQMSPTMFEHLVRQIFEEQGAEGWTTRQSNDAGVDAVIVQRKALMGGLSIVQAKRYSGAIGVSHLRELAGAMEENKAGWGILITTSWFTSGCWRKMRDHGRMDLIDGHRLVHLIKEYLGKEVLIGIPNRPPPREDTER